jgi:tetratricopeptide (TPR) repeat protein
MADDKAKPDPSKPKEGPKPVQLGGESLIDRLIPHIKKIGIATVLLAVIVSFFFGFKACNRNKESKETQKIAAVLDVAQKPVQPPGVPADPKTPMFASEKDRADKVLAEMASQDTDKTGPAFRASMLIDAGKLDEAITTYRSCDQGKEIENVLCREGLGVALETKASAEKDPAAKQKLLEEALATFTRMQPAEDGPRRVYALYHQGRLQSVLGKKDEAKALFEKVKALNPPKELSDLIERRLSAIGAS